MSVRLLLVILVLLCGGTSQLSAQPGCLLPQCTVLGNAIKGIEYWMNKHRA